MQETYNYDITGLQENRGVAVIAKMLLIDDAKDYRDLMKNKLWADLFVELQKGDLGHEDGLHLDAFIEGLIALCAKRSSVSDDADRRFYTECTMKFTQLLVFIRAPRSVVTKPYVTKDEAIKYLKSIKKISNSAADTCCFKRNHKPCMTTRGVCQTT
jgi:hypothetical protein